MEEKISEVIDLTNELEIEIAKRVAATFHPALEQRLKVEITADGKSARVTLEALDVLIPLEGLLPEPEGIPPGIKQIQLDHAKHQNEILRTLKANEAK